MRLKYDGIDASIKDVVVGDKEMERLTISYPSNPEYRDRVLGALSELLKPSTRPYLTPYQKKKLKKKAAV